jgi:hypothetical protein
MRIIEADQSWIGLGDQSQGHALFSRVNGVRRARNGDAHLRDEALAFR